MDNHKKRILVTGSSRGIGREIALRLADDGYDLVLHCRQDMDAAESTAGVVIEKGCKVRILRFDIADRAACADAIENDIAEHGAYYGVVCNAGINADAAFPALTDEDWDRVIRTNLDGFYNVLKPAVLPMVRRRSEGRIITMSSVSGLVGNRGQVNYSASKAGIIGASKALAVELAPKKITVNCVAPGLIESDIIDDDLPLEMILPSIPLGRIGRPQEVAGLVRFLMSEEASYITRQVISVNGGLV
jgi:3-oxoacyl-[acyl-carrier protein] reductase